MTFHRIALCFLSLASCVAGQQMDDIKVASDSMPLVNVSSGRKLNNPTPIVLGCYGPITSFSTTFLATAVLFDIDLRKQTEAGGAGAALKTKFGDPVVPITNLNPNLRVTFVIGTSNSDPEKGVGTALDFFLGMNGLPQVAGVVGGYHSAISMPIASLADVQKMPQVSWGSTSPKLSNKGAYPYFLRTIPPDSIQGGAMWTFIKYFGLPQVSMLYAKESYGEGLYTTVANLAGTAQEAFRISGVGIKYMPVGAGKTYDQAIAGKAIQQAKDSGIKFWLIAMTTDQATMLLATMELPKYAVYNSVSYQLLGSEAVKMGQASPKPSKAIKQGFTKFNPVNKGSLFPKFEAMWLKLKADDVTGTAATARYMLDKMQVLLANGKAAVPTNAMFADMSMFQLEDPFIFDACYTFAFAFNTLLNAGKTVADIKGKLLLDEVWKTKFTGISGPVAFNKDGDRLAQYNIDNYQTPPAGGRRLAANDPVPVTVGYYDAGTGLVVMSASKTMYWMDDKTQCQTGAAPTPTTCKGKPPADLIACDPGFRQEPGTMQCVPCGEGRHTTTRGTPRECDRCTPGTYANKKTGANACIKCPTGFHSTSSSISSTCLPCPKGYYTDKIGLSACIKCPKGTYTTVKNTTKCMSCPSGLTTKETATLDPQECICPAGKYRDLSGSCQKCPPGMTCPTASFQGLFGEYKAGNIGKEKPMEVSLLIQKGHYSKAAAPMSVYKCSSKYLCPGGNETQLCDGTRKDFMCVACKDGYRPNKDLEDKESGATGCSKCGGGKVLYLILIPLVALLALVFIILDKRSSPLDDGPLKIEIMNVLGQVLMFMQILGAMQAASLRFGDPFTKFQRTLISPVVADEFFSDAACLGIGGAVGALLAQILLPALFVCLAVVLFVVGKALGRSTGASLVNAFGEVLTEFYVSITIAVLAPFKCYENPNSTKSMVFRPEILCWEDGSDHGSMVGLGIVGLLLYPLNGLVISLIATLRHPKSMAKNDVGMLMRCYFLFNRWSPQAYWFGVVAVARNFFVALWPMVLAEEKMDWALLLMVNSLALPLLLQCWVKPRRTPAMNLLDVYICFVQLCIMASGAMSLYQTEDEPGIDNSGLSILLLVLTVSIFVFAAAVIIIKVLQLISAGASPLSWSFDIFIDFHGGNGATGVRVLHSVLIQVIRKGKVFYDFDSYNDKGFLGVITDAAKLTTNFVVVLGTETWCRPWCVAAVCAAVQKKIPMTSITIEGAPFEVLTDDDRVVKMLEKQAPRTLLRPLGIADELIPNAIRKVFELSPTNLDLRSFDASHSFVTDLLGGLKRLRRQKNQERTSELVEKLFTKTSMSKTNSSGKWFNGAQEEYAMLLCDHPDPEAVAVSRFMFFALSESATLYRTTARVVAPAPGKKGADPVDNELDNQVDQYDLKNFTQAEKNAFANTGVIEDVDLEAAEFDELVTSKRVTVTVILMTDSSFQSGVQMLRLGHIHKYTNPHSKQVPVRICNAFAMPGKATLDEIESGAKILQGFSSVSEAGIFYTTKSISMMRVLSAVMDCLRTTVSLLDLPRLNGQPLQIRVNKVLLRIIYSARDYKTAEPIADDHTGEPSIFKGVSRPARLSAAGDPVIEEAAEEEIVEVTV